ncbi:MAG: nicotinate-nucleotide adenylyltransferase [Chloroflexota bacterium]
MSKRRIGILGGTFDPPHIGHLILAEYARVALDFERLLFVPAADPPHKRDENKVAIEHRLAMLERAIEGNEYFQISRVDIDRPGPHYSVDMVRLIAESYPHAELYFVMGGDSLRDLPKWYHPAQFIQLCKMAVMRRPDETIQPDMHEQILPGLAERVVMIDAPLVGISSTMIVERISAGHSARYLVPDAVLAYILECRLYETQ